MLKRIASVFLCVILIACVFMSPMAEVKTHAVAITAASVAVSFVASLATTYVISSVTGGTFSDTVNYYIGGALEESVERMSNTWHTVYSLSGLAWNNIKSWWNNRIGGGTLGGDGFSTHIKIGEEDFFHAQSFDGLDWQKIPILTTLMRTDLVNGVWEDYTITLRDKFVITYKIKGVSNALESKVYVYDKATGNEIWSHDIGPNYGAYGNWRIHRPVYVHSTNKVYFPMTNINDPYGNKLTMETSVKWDILNGVTGSEAPAQVSDYGFDMIQDRNISADIPIPTVTDDDTVLIDLPISEEQLENMSEQELYDRIHEIVQVIPISATATDYGYIDKGDDLVSTADDTIVVGNPATVGDDTIVTTIPQVVTVFDNTDVPAADVVTPAQAVNVAIEAPAPSYTQANERSMSLPRLLLSKFPFCLVQDIYKMTQLLNTQAEVLDITIPVVLSNLGDDELGGDVHIDLSDFEPVARIVRFFVFLIFCAGLAMVTKEMMF